jgi:PhoPQ-activated pathogenicity-related protein
MRTMAEATPARRNRGETITTGIAREFFVAGELSKRGWIATLTAKNTPDIDVLASRPTGDVHARIQVKADHRRTPTLTA